MTDPRPTNCRFRRQEEGKSYPRSSCTACGKGIITGLGNSCSVVDTDTPKDPALTIENMDWKLVENACRAYCRMIKVNPDQVGYFSELWSGPRPLWELYTSQVVNHMRMSAAIQEAVDLN